LERHLEPRPGVHWPTGPAVLAHDAEMAGCGVTTVFDAMRVGSLSTGRGKYAPFARGLADHLLSFIHDDKLKIKHLIHLRAEICAHTLVDELAAFSEQDRVGIVSVMDHTPGQRQFRDFKKYKTYIMGKRGIDEAAFQTLVDVSIKAREDLGVSNENAACAAAVRLGAVMASHDDTTVEHVENSTNRGMRLAEFPTTVEAARACRERGIAIMMGAPNLMRGGSHSGNVSALELAQQDLLDVISSDYVPAALLQSALMLANLWGDLPRAMRTVSTNPAAAAGLQDRGQIAIGQRADVVCYEPIGNIGVIRRVVSDGKIVA
jgi:alpha-D-ribose 1-methylphosphonate 5-triphosphate diphosphatase